MRGTGNRAELQAGHQPGQAWWLVSWEPGMGWSRVPPGGDVEEGRAAVAASGDPHPVVLESPLASNKSLS